MDPALPEKKPFPPRWLPLTLRLLRYAITLGVALTLASFGNNLLQDLGLFAGCVFVVLFLPYLVSFAIWRQFRFILHTAGVVILGGMIALVLLDFHLSDRAMEKTVQGMTEQLKAEQRNNTPVDPDQIEGRMHALKNQADQSNSPEGALMSALTSLGLELVAKVKTAQAAEQAAGDYHPAQLTTRDDLASQIDSISSLRAKQADVLVFLQDFYVHVRTVLFTAGVGNDDINDLIARTRQGRDLGPFIALQQSKVKLSDDRLAQLHFLDKNWGRWHAQNDRIVFADPKAQATFNNLNDTLQTDTAQLESPQK